MYKKLDEETIKRILRTGAAEFGNKGYDNTNINIVARQAGVSVGVIYKYYGTKKDFFLACVEFGLKYLEDELRAVSNSTQSVKETLKAVIRDMIQFSKLRPEMNRLYNQIGAEMHRDHAVALAKSIEERSVKVYEDMYNKLLEAGVAPEGVDHQMMAFFYDSLIIMLQYSYSSDYYKERAKLFLGDDIFENDERMVEALAEFLYRGLQVQED